MENAVTVMLPPIAKDAFFETISDLYVNNGNIDRFNVRAHLENRGKLNAAGGSEYIFAVANTDGVMSNIDSYITIVREKSRMRALVNALEGLSKEALGGRRSVNDIVETGVGKLMEMSIKLGKPVNPNLHIGICGEHGGDPSSVEFCHKIGLDYVSCSPFRVPIARLAAAQAAINNSSK